MNGDLISREALLKEIDIAPDEWAKGRTISAIIANAPAVGAAPVVRCCECKRFDTGYCYYWEAGTSCEDFCSRGAKMDE